MRIHETDVTSPEADKSVRGAGNASGGAVEKMDESATATSLTTDAQSPSEPETSVPGVSETGLGKGMLESRPSSRAIVRAVHLCVLPSPTGAGININKAFSLIENGGHSVQSERELQFALRSALSYMPSTEDVRTIEAPQRWSFVLVRSVRLLYLLSLVQHRYPTWLENGLWETVIKRIPLYPGPRFHAEAPFKCDCFLRVCIAVLEAYRTGKTPTRILLDIALSGVGPKAHLVHKRKIKWSNIRDLLSQEDISIMNKFNPYQPI